MVFPFPLRTFAKNGTNPSTIVLVIVVTDRHTDKPTPVKNETYSLAFAGIITAVTYDGALA